MSGTGPCDLCGEWESSLLASYDEEACADLGIGHRPMSLCQPCCAGLDCDSRRGLAAFIADRKANRRMLQAQREGKP